MASSESGSSAFRVQAVSSDPASYNYPFATAPDIIRSYQKDAYFQGVLLEHLSTILRQLKGSRFVQTHTSGLRTSSDVLYLCLTTLLANRTLGEEYCDIIQVEGDTLRLPHVGRRGGYIVSSILLPYALTRFLPVLRRRLRAKLESNLRRLSRKATNHGDPSNQATLKRPLSHTVQSYLLQHLDALTSPSPLHALTLATFYFSGSYYHLSKRLFSLRYIFTKRLLPNEARVGYEVLGVLLILQISVQAWLHMHHTLRMGAPPAPTNVGSAGSGSAVLDGGVEVPLEQNIYSAGGSNNDVLHYESDTPAASKVGVEKMTHTPMLDKPRYELKDDETMQWIAGRQQRKCTLCLEEMKDPSATTCGHIFCWTCIGDWCREKPECPLCRQTSMPQHILPLRI
ncbi:MAG: peroxisome biogenesis factor 10 [Sclerophora amabilis]|nr:MAG: peroxisome biogenesis factor 10 [Sclerophora amabilis]